MIDWIINSKPKIKYEGKYNFYLHCNIDRIDSSSTITITAFSNQNQKAAIPCHYAWFIIKNGVSQEIIDFKGSTFICEPNHVGYFVQTHVISNDQEFSGKAIVTMGPVQLDVALKTEILSALSQGMSSFPVYLMISEQQQKECQLKIFENHIKINHAYSDLNYMFDYSILEPMISPNSKQFNKISIIFNEKYEMEMRNFERKLFGYEELNNSRQSIRSAISRGNSNSGLKFEIKFLNRSSRDIFLYTVKAFITKKEMKLSVVLKKMQNINFEGKEQFNSILQIDSLKSDIIRYDKLYKKTLKEKKVLQEQVHKLQAEMENMVITYTKIVEEKFKNARDLNNSYSMLSIKRDQVINNKYHRLENQNGQLNHRIQMLVNQIEQIRQNQSMFLVNNNPIETKQSAQSHVFMQSKYQNNVIKSPFQKKSYDSQSLVNILDDFSRSEIMRDFQELDLKQNLINKLKSQKRSLEDQLERSFQKIDNLQKRIYKTQNSIGSNINATAINFTYKQPDQVLELNRSNENLQRQITQLKMKLKIVEMQNKRLANDLALKNKANNHKLESHLDKIRLETKNTDLLTQSKLEQQKNLKLRQELQAKNERIQHLEQLFKEYNVQIKYYEDQVIRLQRKNNDLEMQLEINKKNQNILNRSQNLSLQMENYNEQQINILKEHNNFLVNQNQKLVKACEKYMSDAKQTNMLRQEIIQLRQKLNKALTNPETNSFTL